MLVKTFTVIYHVRSQFDYDSEASLASYEPLWGDTPLTVMQAAGLPLQYSACPFDPTCRCVKMSTKKWGVENEKGKLWEVTVEFTNKPVKFCFEQSIENPLLQPAVISATTQSVTETATFHYTAIERPVTIYVPDPNTGIPIPTTVMELFNWAKTLRMSNGIEMTEVDRETTKVQVSISFNRPTFNQNLCYGLLDHINWLPMWGFDRGLVKYSNFAWSREYYGLCFTYYKLTFTFDIQVISGYDRNGVPVYGFVKRILDHGTRYIPEGKEQSLKNLVVARTADGSGEVDICLDGSGHAIAGQLSEWDTESGMYLDPNDMYFHNIQRYPMADFTLLGIPILI
jgi:hypothetical protein